MLQRIFLSCFVFIALCGCAPEKNNILSNTYHNLTAHYNAYFIAKEDIEAIKAQIDKQYTWNYNEILPVFAQFDSVVAQSYAKKTKDCIEKASMVIQRHKGSKWEDDAYVLIGEARFYSLDFENAVETFKYVNTKGEDDKAKHQALIGLMRTFIDHDESKNALAVSEYLKKEKLNRRNLKNLYLTRGYLYQNIADYGNMVHSLVQAVPMMTRHKVRARICFTIGQVYQRLGLDAEAFQYYRQTLRNHPPYELAFYTQLNMAQVTQVAKKYDTKRIRRYFKRLLRDRKNEEFKDKIYYEMARFEVRNHHLDLGIQHYNSSIRASVNNPRQKAYSYLNLGRIYYDSLADYKRAKLYYDSTISVLPKDDRLHKQVQARQEILADFVKQWTIIQKNDSLLRLSNLNQEALNTFLDQHIAQEKARALAKKKQEQKKKREASSPTSSPFFDQNTKAIGSGNYTGSVWYFYNPSTVSRGRAEFLSLWGDIPLENNWGLPNPAGISTQEEEEKPEEKAKAKNQPTAQDKPEEDSATPAIDKSALIATLPKTPEEKQKLLKEIEEATYRLGKIYHFKLNEKPNAVQTFETLIQRFSKSEYRHEVMYLLYVICRALSDTPKSEHYKNRLLSEAPKSIYTKIILNPNYRVESEAASTQLKKIYAKAYHAYQNHRPKAALKLIDEGLKQYPDNDFVDNMALLKILAQAYLQPAYAYEANLNRFAKAHPASEMIPHVDSLIAISEQHQIHLINSAKAVYTPPATQPHLVVFAFKTHREKSSELLTPLENLTAKQKHLKVSSVLLDRAHTIMFISGFPDPSSAMQFIQTANAEVPKPPALGEIQVFSITQENFDTLYQTQALEDYLAFYNRSYPPQK